MTVPIPDPTHIPPVAEIEARQAHAQHLRAIQPGITDREILDAWAALDGRDRWQRIGDARVELLARAARECQDLVPPGTMR